MDTECTCSALRLASESLTVSQYSVLGNLAKRDADRETGPDGGAPPSPPHPRGQPSMTELADLLGLDRTTLAPNLRPLERDGDVLVAPDERDCRLPLWRAAQARLDRSFGTARALRASLAAVARRADARHAEAAPAAERD